MGGGPEVHPSPDGRHVLELFPDEMRMSHWIFPFRVRELAAGHTILDLGDTVWSVDAHDWRSEPAALELRLRRYPGDARGIRLIVSLSGGTHRFRDGLDEEELPSDSVLPRLEAWYQACRR